MGVTAPRAACPPCPSAGPSAPEGRAKQGVVLAPGLEPEEFTALLTPRNPAICPKYSPPPPLPLGNPYVPTPAAPRAGPHARLTVPTILQRISRGRIPAPQRPPRVPSPAGPGTRGHL